MVYILGFLGGDRSAERPRRREAKGVDQQMKRQDPSPAPGPAPTTQAPAPPPTTQAPAPPPTTQAPDPTTPPPAPPTTNPAPPPVTTQPPVVSSPPPVSDPPPTSIIPPPSSGPPSPPSSNPPSSVPTQPSSLPPTSVSASVSFSRSFTELISTATSTSRTNPTLSTSISWTDLIPTPKSSPTKPPSTWTPDPTTHIVKVTSTSWRALTTSEVRGEQSLSIKSFSTTDAAGSTTWVVPSFYTTVLTSSSNGAPITMTVVVQQLGVRDQKEGSGFFQNKPAVVGVFVVAGILGAALLLFGIFKYFKHKRAKETMLDALANEKGPTGNPFGDGGAGSGLPTPGMQQVAYQVGPQDNGYGGAENPFNENRTISYISSAGQPTPTNLHTGNPMVPTNAYNTNPVDYWAQNGQNAAANYAGGGNYAGVGSGYGAEGNGQYAVGGNYGAEGNAGQYVAGANYGAPQNVQPQVYANEVPGQHAAGWNAPSSPPYTAMSDLAEQSTYSGPTVYTTTTANGRVTSMASDASSSAREKSAAYTNLAVANQGQDHPVAQSSSGGAPGPANVGPYPNEKQRYQPSPDSMEARGMSKSPVGSVSPAASPPQGRGRPLPRPGTVSPTSVYSDEDPFSLSAFANSPVNEKDPRSLGPRPPSMSYNQYPQDKKSALGLDANGAQNRS